MIYPASMSNRNPTPVSPVATLFSRACRDPPTGPGGSAAPAWIDTLARLSIVAHESPARRGAGGIRRLGAGVMSATPHVQSGAAIDSTIAPVEFLVPSLSSTG